MMAAKAPVSPTPGSLIKLGQPAFGGLSGYRMPDFAAGTILAVKRWTGRVYIREIVIIGDGAPSPDGTDTLAWETVLIYQTLTFTLA